MNTRLLQRILDVAIQLFIIAGLFYAAYELLVVFHLPGKNLVLFGDATSIDLSLLVARRLYALEFWIILTCYFVYLGVRKKIWR